MKTVLLLAFAGVFVHSLRAQPDFEKADAFARSFKNSYKDAADLALQLTKPFETEAEKARVIFTWVAENIRYDYAKFKNPPPKPVYRGRTRQEIEEEKKEWLEEDLQYTLRKKKGVCADYSQLVQRMCETAGLESVIVSGESRRLRGRSGSHAWNAIKIDGQWRLVDATWGSGYIDDESDRFVSRFSPGFFDTPPDLFALDHFPTEEKWQLLEKPVLKTDFRKQPMVNYGNPAFALRSFAPSDGKLRMINGQTEVRLKFGQAPPPALLVVAGLKRVLTAEVKTTDDG